MSNHIHEVYVYVEHCCQAGQLVPRSKLESYGEECDDFRRFSGTIEELLETVSVLRNEQASPYQLKCAESILSSLNHHVAFRVKNAAGEYLCGWDDDGEPTRTTSATYAHEFRSKRAAEEYCVDETDIVVSEFVSDF